MMPKKHGRDMFIFIKTRVAYVDGISAKVVYEIVDQIASPQPIFTKIAPHTHCALFRDTNDAIIGHKMCAQ